MVNKYTYIGLYLDNIRKTINLNEFELHYKKPHQTIKRHLNILVKEKILLAEKKNKFLFYSLNLKNPLVYEYIAIAEKQKLFEFLENPLFNRLYMLLERYFDESKILVFGSSVKQDFYSDIDLLIINEKLDNQQILKELKDFGMTYSVIIHPIISKDVDLGDTFIEEIIKNHIIFNNHDFFLRLFYGKK